MATLYLDTETTGLGEPPETDIVEVALIDEDGGAIINTLCNPGFHIPGEATAIHGITDEILCGAPSSDAVRKQVLDALKGQHVVIYNADFDCAFFPGIYDTADVFCCMRRFAPHGGLWNDYFCSWTWRKLSVAAKMTGFRLPDGLKFHRAFADALASRHVWRWLEEVEKVEEDENEEDYNDIPF